LDSINWIQPLRSPTSCAAKHGSAYGPSNFGIRAEICQAVNLDIESYSHVRFPNASISPTRTG
jgi:hypothetical protein